MAAKLSVVEQLKPPRKLDKHGANLWRNIMREYEIDDAGGLEMLASACGPCRAVP